MQASIQQAAVQIADRTGVNALFRFINRGCAAILMYHGVCDENFTLLNGYDERHVPISHFKQQLEVIRDCGYSFVTLSELVTRLKRGQSVGRLAVLTFDDGFRNVVRHAYPIMKEYDAKGCFFVVSNFVGNRTLLWTDTVETWIRAHAPETLHVEIEGGIVRYPLDTKARVNTAMMDLKSRLRKLPNDVRMRWMAESGMTDTAFIEQAPEEFAPANWEELQALDPSILEIGSHTQNHPNCDTIRERRELEMEIAGSKQEIETRLGRKIEHFCYPAGAFNPETIEAVRGAGYVSAVTTIQGFARPGTDLFTLSRISGDGDLMRFRSVVSGSLPWLRRSAHFLPISQ
jgi:peptidoglycan/xylan/chitin deacetylase (PgdA/CDA1 family)